jgi:hypothetical protein
MSRYYILVLSCFCLQICADIQITIHVDSFYKVDMTQMCVALTEMEYEYSKGCNVTIEDAIRFCGVKLARAFRFRPRSEMFLCNRDEYHIRSEYLNVKLHADGVFKHENDRVEMGLPCEPCDSDIEIESLVVRSDIWRFSTKCSYPDYYIIMYNETE